MHAYRDGNLSSVTLTSVTPMISSYIS
jgi:hypothetical protein